MKRIAAAIVKYRYIIFCVMLAIGAVCALIAPRVGINTDMTKYLPSDSQMREGMDIMTAEFPDTEIYQTIRVMFTGLADEEKPEIAERIGALEYVSSVDYSAGDPDYNSGEHTLFVINTAYDYESPEEEAIMSALDEEFADYDMVYKDDNPTTSEIPLPVLVIAIGFLLVILFAMCASWTEPVLFMATIGLAILINMGTNLIMGSVSSITFSISAILQLVLSMDYSIILMNRYRQERASDAEGSRPEAMARALSGAFSSILGSGMTTVVGLLMLVFMSFRIGLDLGVVLAKGVLMSMICVFTVLPCLILMFDRAIDRTAKRELNIPLEKIAPFSFRTRRVVAAGFIVLFVVSCFTQTLTKTVYTLKTDDPVAEVFTPANPIVLLYSNSDEAQTPALVEWVEEQPGVSEVFSYSNTLGAKYTADELGAMLGEFGSADTPELPDVFIDMLLCDYFSDGETGRMTASEFIDLLLKLTGEGSEFGEYLDGAGVNAEQLGALASFSDPELLTTPLDAEELAGFLGISADQAGELLLYYYTLHGGANPGKLTLREFVSFVTGEVASDPEYGSLIDRDTLAGLEELALFTDTAKMTTPVGYRDAASMLGIGAEDMRLLYICYYAALSDYTPPAMTAEEFVEFISSELATNKLLAEYIDQSTAAKLTTFSAFTDPANITAPRDSEELASILGVDEGLVEQVFRLYAGASEDPQALTASLAEFTAYIAEEILPSNPELFDETAAAQFTQLNSIVSLSASGAQLTASELAAALSLDETAVQAVFAYSSTVAGKEVTAMTLPDFLSTVLSSPDISALLPAETLSALTSASAVASTAASGAQLTAAELAATLGLDEAQVSQLLALRAGQQVEITMSLYDFVDFLLAGSGEGGSFAGYLPEETVRELSLAQSIMQASLAGTQLSYSEMAAATGLDANTVKLLYTMSDATQSADSWKIPVRTLLNFLLSGNLPSSAELSSAQTAQLRTALNIVNASVAGTKYTPDALAQLLGTDAAQLEPLYLLYLNRHGDTSGWQMSPADFLKFLSVEVLTDETFADSFDAEQAEGIRLAAAISDAVVSGREMSASEMSALLGADTLDEGTAGLLYLYAAATQATAEQKAEWALTPQELVGYLTDSVATDPRFAQFITDDLRAELDTLSATLDDAAGQLKGAEHSLMSIDTTLPAESEETSAFIESLLALSDELLPGGVWLIGNSPMNYEMETGFGSEMLLITLLTAISIFIVVAATFRSLAVPTVLVLIVQCGVFLTMTINGVLGYSVYYLALIIVQCILMGATIDYGILFTNYYRDIRATLGIQDSLAAAFRGSEHTILTSGAIMVIVTAILGFAPVEPTISQICRAISIGALCATLLILFVLPGFLAATDRFVAGKHHRSNREDA